MAHYWLPDATSGTGTGNWSATGATGHWADDAVGTNLGKAAPGAGDDVYFGASAFNGAGQTVTVDAAANCLSMDWTGATNTPTLTRTSSLSIYGNCAFISAMTVGGGGTIYLKPASGSTKTFTSAGKTFTEFQIYAASGTGKVILQDTFVCTSGTFSMILGILDVNDVPFTIVNMSNQYSGSNTLTLGNSTVTCNGNWNLGYAATTLTANTSTINCSGNFSGGGLTTYNIVNLTGATSTITGSNTIPTLGLTRAGVQTITFTDGTTQTIGRLTRDAGVSVKTLGGSGAAGWNIATAGSIQSLDYISISRSTASPLGKFFAGNHSTDGGNNVGWYFATPVPFTGGSLNSMGLGIRTLSVITGSVFKRI